MITEDEKSRWVFCEYADQRLEVCKSCDQLSSRQICVQCSCFIPIKVNLPWTKCPLGKWKN